LLLTLTGVNAGSISADQSTGIHQLNISDEVEQKISALPEEHQAFLSSDRLFSTGLSKVAFVKLLQGKTVQELKKSIQELMYLESKLSIRTAADTSNVDLENLGLINEQLDNFIAD
jgi:predicted transposase